MRFAICFALAACSAPQPAPLYPVVPLVACSTRATIAVLGGVNRPGTFACHPGMRLVEAVVAAGGLSPIGWGNQTRLRRDHRMYLVNLQAIDEGRAPDPMLAPDDVITIPVRDW